MVSRRTVFQCAALLVAMAVATMGGILETEAGTIVLKGVLPIDPLNPNALLVPTNIYVYQGNITKMVPTAFDTGCPFPALKGTPCDKELFSVIDYTKGATQFFAVPGFVSTASSMVLRSAIPSSLANNVQSDLETAIASDFASLNPTDTSATAQAVRIASYNTVLQAALQSGVTTWIDSLTNPGDFAALRNNFASEGQNQLHLPNLYSMGPLITLAGGFVGFADNTPFTFTIPVDSLGAPTQSISTIISNLNTQMVQWFNPAIYNFVGATVVCESIIGSSSVSMPPALISAIVSQIVSYGKVAGFISNNAANMVTAANAGARVHYGAPYEPKQETSTSNIAVCNTGNVNFNHIQCQTAMNALSTLVTLGVVHTTEASAYGGGAAFYLSSFPPYPNPAASVYYPRSYYSLGMPANIRSNYEAIFAQVASNTASAVAFKTGNTNFAATYQGVINYAGAQGVPFIVASGSGLGFTFHSDSLLEGSLVAGSSAFVNNSAVLYGMTYGAAKAFNLHWKVGRLYQNYTADVIVMSNNPITTPVLQWNIVDVFKFGYKQPDVGVTFTFGTAVALGAFGFAVLLVILFVVYTLCCARIATQARRGDMAQSML